MSLPIATFNVRGLCDESKRQNLGIDMIRYKVDVGCLQETKIKAGCSELIKGCELNCFPTEIEAYGLGFIVNDKWKEKVYRQWKVNDRIAVIQLNPEMKKYTNPVYRSRKMAKGIRIKIKIKNNRHMITIINCYAPHSELTKQEPGKTEKFYDRLEKLIRNYKNKSSIMIVAGDMNACIGKRTNQNCIGKNSKGTINENGEHLVNLCESNNLVLTNTCFSHKQSHLTSWQQTRVDKNTNKVQHIRKVLDYIMIEDQFRHILTNSRTYQGTMTISDHRLLITTMQIGWYLVHQKKNKTSNNKKQKFDTQKLVNEEPIRQQYKQELQEKVGNSNNIKWKDLAEMIKETAKNIVGLVKPTKRKKSMYSDEIEALSKAQKHLKIQIDNLKNAEKISDLRNQRNKLLKEIKREQSLMREKEIENATSEITNAQNDHQFYKAVKYLRNPNSKSKNIVHDKKGRIITNPDEQYKVVKKHFQEHFYDPSKKKIQRFIGEPKQLNNRITGQEVTTVTKRMNNNKAAGDDEILSELLKYAPENVHQEIANNLNNVLETHEDQINFGLSILLPTLKPKKIEGPTKHLRPLNLLNTIRKTLSLITLNRIKPKVDKYITPSQAAYRANRSTTDIIWAHRFIIAKAIQYQQIEIEVTGLDMSSAFDTIDREELMSVLKDILDEDEVRMCRLLLSDTTMKMRFGKHEEETFESNKGSPQGDAISGVLFNIAFENALRDLRSVLNKQNTNLEHSYSKKSHLPNELIYADDSDFPTEDNQRKGEIRRIANPILSEHSLKVNDDKWEKTVIKRSKKPEEEFEWRNTKKLGSLLGDCEDMKRRIQLSNIAMQSVEKIWPNKKVKIHQRLKIYKSIIKSILTYNMCTWGLTKAQIEDLDRTHRKQLRRVFNDPNKRNIHIYRDSKEKPLSVDMKERRWKAFGHMLRLDEQAPCQQAMRYYFDVPPNAKRYPGRRRTTLPVVIDEDIKKAARSNVIQVSQFESREDLKILKRVAEDRKLWRKLTSIICGNAEDDE